MAEKNTAVFGIYSTTAAAESAAATLVGAGFSNSDISVLAPDQSSPRELGTEKATKAPEGTTTGVAAGGALGGTLGLLVGMGIPEYEAKRYEGRVRDGGVLLSVHTATSDRVKVAQQVLERTGAEDISSSGEASADTPTATRSATRY